MTGRVVWITGLAGAGKTTVARLVTDALRARGDHVVLLDGDALREVFGGVAGHGVDDRRALAASYGRLCRMLAEQGVDVVCATISMFAEVRAWNRAHIARYLEVYLRVPMAVLAARDQRGLYSRALRGEEQNVMGVDLPFDEPTTADLVVDNDGAQTPAEVCARIVQLLPERAA